MKKILTFALTVSMLGLWRLGAGIQHYPSEGL